MMMEELNPSQRALVSEIVFLFLVVTIMLCIGVPLIRRFMSENTDKRGGPPVVEPNEVERKEGN
jgi:hypothetical protein